MQDQKFEKEVQQKMEELSFPPSDAVWTNVDAAINGERRRRLPVFWVLLFLGLSLAGSLYLVFTPAKKNMAIPAIAKKEAQSNDATVNEKPFENAAPETNARDKQHQNDITVITPEKKITGDKRRSKTKALVTGSRTGVTVEKDKNSIAKNIKQQQEPEKQISGFRNAGTFDKSMTTADATANAPAQDTASQITASATSNTPPSAPVNSAVSASKEKDVVADTAKTAVVIVKQAKKNKNPWQFGFTAGGGLSSGNGGLIKNSVANSPSSNISPAANPHNPSEVKSNLSFNVGIFLQRQLSKRMDFSIGAGYHYYSTSMQTGSTYPGLYNVAFFSSMGSTYYANGRSNKYINHYHYLELPVSLGVRLDKNNKWPVYWNAGLAFSYLVSTDGLHFDPANGIYFNNNNLFNKWQAGVTSSLMIGIPVHGRIFQAGPQVQYGFTDLLKSNQGSKEHLFFAGIKISALLGKK